jgi:branched-chain amino acid transport system permease protein
VTSSDKLVAADAMTPDRLEPTPLSAQAWLRRDLDPAFAAIIIAIAAVVLIFSAPGGTYYLGLLVVWASYSLVVIGLDIPVGWLHEVSVGQAGAMAVGAYAGVKCFGLGPWGLLVAVLVSLVAGGTYGALCGLFAARVHGFALATFTLVVGEATILVFQEVGALGALSGVVVTPPDVFGTQLDLTDIASASLCLLAIGLVISRRMRYATFGRKLVAVGENPRAAASFGINLFKARFLGFTIAGAYAGLGGVVLVLSLEYFSADQFDVNIGILFLAMLIIGGRGTLTGPLLGAAVFVLGQQYIPSGVGISGITFGLITLVAVWVIPGGLVRLPRLIERGIVRFRLRMSMSAARSR